LVDWGCDRLRVDFLDLSVILNLEIDCEVVLKSRMSIIGRGYLPLGKSPIFNGQKCQYESPEKSYFLGYSYKSENQRLTDGGRVALLRKAQLPKIYEISI
jgi:hypothetical protein